MSLQPWLKFIVSGQPQPRGSKSPMAIGIAGGGFLVDPIGHQRPTVHQKTRNGQKYILRGGRPLVTTKDSNPKGKAWMQSIRAVAEQVTDDSPLLLGPVGLGVEFYLTRPLSHFGTGRNAGLVKPSAPGPLHCYKPDIGKLMRPVEDALTGVVYADDAQICAYVPPMQKYWTCAEGRAVIYVYDLADVPLSLIGEKQEELKHGQEENW